MAEIASQIEVLPVEGITPYINNSRTHSDSQVAQVAASIQEFGFTNPILIDADNSIIAGHGRLLAAQRLGITEVPCIRLGYLTDHQKRAYVIADNKLALNAGWDIELLNLELSEIDDSDLDIEITGFGEAEIIALTNSHSDLDQAQDWDGMPNYDHDDKRSFRHVIVHFETPDDAAEFFSMISVNDTGKTKSIWYPEQEDMDTGTRRYADGG